MRLEKITRALKRLKEKANREGRARERRVRNQAGRRSRRSRPAGSRARTDGRVSVYPMHMDSDARATRARVHGFFITMF
jgi:hypothetical protein